MQNGPMTQPILNGGEFDGDEGWGIIMEGGGWWMKRGGGSQEMARADCRHSGGGRIHEERLRSKLEGRIPNLKRDERGPCPHLRLQLMIAAPLRAAPSSQSLLVDPAVTRGV